MPPSYSEALHSLYALGHELHRTPTHKFELAHVRTLLAALGNPERYFKSVLIAGTNGKGSTAATLASILACAGHRTGLYTSPHLVRPNERLKVNGSDINDDSFASAFARVEETAVRLVSEGALPWHPSFFEMLTAMAFVHFREQSVELAVLEVGMGGRLDATNVVDPLVSVITDISLDHQQFLGNTIREIAREKAGIIRPGGVVVTLPQHPEANDIIGNTILELGARGVSAVQYVPPVSPGAAKYTAATQVHHPERIEESAVRNRYPLEVMGEQILVDSPLPGRHQLRNLALAIATAEQLNAQGVNVTPKDIERGIRETRWAGRFQVLPRRSGWPEVILDVAHNAAGAWALRSVLSERYSERPVTFVFGIMRDKAMAEVAQVLFAAAERVIATQPSGNPRAATAEQVAEVARNTVENVMVEPTVADALQRARELTGENGVVVVTGSIYIVGEALQALT